MPLPCSQKLVELYAITSAGAGSKEKKKKPRGNEQETRGYYKKEERKRFDPLYVCWYIVK
jgi:hypothetical protein